MKHIVPLLLLFGCGSPELDKPNPPPNWSLESTPIPKEVPEEPITQEPAIAPDDATDDVQVDTETAPTEAASSPEEPPAVERDAPALAPPAVE